MVPKNYIIVAPDDFDLDDGADAEGAFLFEDLQGALQPKTEQLEAYIRKGFDGETTRKTGVRGKPFPAISLHWIANRAAGLAAIAAYISLIDGNAYEVVQHGVSWGFYKVFDVIPLDMLPAGATAGTLLQSQSSPIQPTACQRVLWLLVSTTAPEAP